MPGSVFVDCPVHGIVENFDAIGLGDNSATLIGFTAWCPYDNIPSPVIDGEYSATWARLRPTPLQLKRLQWAIERAETEIATRASNVDRASLKLRREAKRIAPEVVKLADATTVQLDKTKKRKKGKGRWKWVAVFIAVTTWLGLDPASVIDHITTDQLIDQIWDQLQEAEQRIDDLEERLDDLERERDYPTAPPAPAHPSNPPPDDEITIHPV